MDHAGQRRPRPRPRHARAPAATCPAAAWRDPAVWAGADRVVTIGLWALTGGLVGLIAGGVDTMLGLSRLAGIVAALGALFGLVLTARPAWLERTAGLDRMVGWHRWPGWLRPSAWPCTSRLR